MSTPNLAEYMDAPDPEPPTLQDLYAVLVRGFMRDYNPNADMHRLPFDMPGLESLGRYGDETYAFRAWIERLHEGVKQLDREVVLRVVAHAVEFAESDYESASKDLQCFLDTPPSVLMDREERKRKVLSLHEIKFRRYDELNLARRVSDDLDRLAPAS